jgi:hypothetical protein
MSGFFGERVFGTFLSYIGRTLGKFAFKHYTRTNIYPTIKEEIFGLVVIRSRKKLFFFRKLLHPKRIY